MKSCVLAASAALCCAISFAAEAQDLACGTTYTVARGDYLTGITKRAYGVATPCKALHEHNMSVIGANADLIEPGMELEIPCLDGYPVQAASEDDSVEPELASVQPVRFVQPGIDRPDRPISFVAGGDWAPFLDQSEEHGGMFVELVTAAMDTVTASPEDYRIDWVNDWEAHLTPLISESVYDFSLAWFRPNCDLAGKLGDSSKFRCEMLDWSESLYEEEIGYYTRADDAVLTAYADLFGKSICRPAGYSTFMLEEVDLVDPNIRLSTPIAPEDCFTGLADGTYDATVLAVDVADGIISDLGLSDRVSRQNALRYMATLHAVTAKSNPHGAENLALLDAGIREIKTNGDWFHIVRRQLAEFRRNN